MPTRVWVDLDLNFQSNPVTGDISLSKGDLAVIRSIEHLVQLGHFESPFHPDIGGNVDKLLFELATDVTASALQKEITNVIQNFEPRAKINFINVDGSPDNNGYDVRVEFFVQGSLQPVAVNFFLERVG